MGRRVTLHNQKHWAKCQVVVSERTALWFRTLEKRGWRKEAEKQLVDYIDKVAAEKPVTPRVERFQRKKRHIRKRLCRDKSRSCRYRCGIVN